MSKLAFVFPGQGSQFVGMAKDLHDNSEEVKNIFLQFNSILGKDLANICFNGPEDELKQTVNTQPAILAHSIAAYSLLKEKYSINPDYLAGHSLGEYAALYASNALSLENTIKLIKKRSELMSEAQSGSMSAILGFPEEDLKKVLEEASSEGSVTIANYNTPEQIVITGEEKAVKKANELCEKAGARRVIPLAVSGAFHSPLMKQAAITFAKTIKETSVNDATIPVITNVDAKETTSQNEFSKKMSEQIYNSVYWTQTVQYLMEQGVDTFVEIGPGKVLSGMIKKINRKVKVLNVSDMDSLEKTLNSLNA